MPPTQPARRAAASAHSLECVVACLGRAWGVLACLGWPLGSITRCLCDYAAYQERAYFGGFTDVYGHVGALWVFCGAHMLSL